MTTTSDLEYTQIRDDEIDALDAVLSPALHFSPGGMRDWIVTLGVEQFRAVRQRGRIVAGLGVIELAQWLGGVRVPMAGITAVGVVPDQRGAGVGSFMLRAMLEELHAGRTPISALYPATLPYYQRAGYERAGLRITYELPIEAIDTREQSLALVPIAAEHYEDVYRAYERRAIRSAGNLDRPAWMWQHRLEPRDRQPLRFLVRHEDQTEGYIIFNQGGRSDPLSVVDLCVLTPRAGRRLLALLAGYRSMVEKLVWSGGPLDPFVYLLSEQLTAGQRPKVNVVRSLDWMLRIVDVLGALSARGYPAGLNAELHLDVRDDLLAANNGRFVLEIADGRASVQPGGQGRIRLHVRDLAAMYTGYMSPFELSVLGALDGPDQDLAIAGAVFSGPRPWIADMF